MKNKATWQKLKIKDLLDYKRPDEFIVKSTHYTDNGYPVLTANKSFILGYTPETSGVYTKLPAIIFDDFTTDSKYVNFPFKVKSSAIKILKEKNSNVDLRFVYELIKSIHFPVGNHKRYYISEYQNLDVDVPPYFIQKKIAVILLTLDEAIQKTNQIIQKTEVLKQGLMNELLTKGIGHKKFKKTKLGEIPEEWNVVPLIELGELQRGYDLPSISRTKGAFPLVSSNGITDSHNEYKVQAPGVVTGRSGTIGKVFYIDKPFWPLNTTLYIKNFFGNNPKFVYYSLINFGLNRYLTGTGVPTLNRNVVHSVPVVIPQIIEQKMIAEILSNVDEKISIEIMNKEKLMIIKKGLMQDIFSQKVQIN